MQTTIKGRLLMQRSKESGRFNSKDITQGKQQKGREELPLLLSLLHPPKLSPTSELKNKFS